MRTDSVAEQARAAAAPSAIVQAASAQAVARREAVAYRGIDLLTGNAPAVEQGSATAAVAADESSTEVVEELLSENEKLRLIIQDMKEEVGRPFWYYL